MKISTLFGLTVVTATLALALGPRSSLGQAAADDALLAPLIEEIAKQQTQVVENQAKIDEKLAGIAEDLRLARIFVGRGGGKVIGK
jgi:RsiW-degrading membrane proteinase PrsW (M82 family)